MSTSALAPLFLLGPQQPNAMWIRGGEISKEAPLLWGTWTGVTPKTPQPNPAPNRAISAPQTGLANELAALTALAHSLQHTADKVTEAHGQFLRNQEAALDQIQAISHLLQSFQDEI